MAGPWRAHGGAHGGPMAGPWRAHGRQSTAIRPPFFFLINPTGCVQILLEHMTEAIACSDEDQFETWSDILFFSCITSFRESRHVVQKK